jgi:hypothetical protein
LGHDVVTAAQLGLSQADDSELLRVAKEQGRIFITLIATSAVWYSCAAKGLA